MRSLSLVALLALGSGHSLESRASAAVSLRGSAPQQQSAIAGVIPPGTLTHFCVVCSYEGFNATLATYARFLGVEAPVPGIAGGIDSNGTYMNGPLTGKTLIAFMSLNNKTQMEFLAGDANPSWWRDVYLEKGYEVHHMGYALPAGTPIWPVVTAFTAAGLGPWVQYGRWGTIDQSGSGCYVYMDSQKTLGVTVEILASGPDCDDLPLPPKPPAAPAA